MSWYYGKGFNIHVSTIFIFEEKLQDFGETSLEGNNSKANYIIFSYTFDSVFLIRCKYIPSVSHISVLMSILIYISTQLHLYISTLLFLCCVDLFRRP